MTPTIAELVRSGALVPVEVYGGCGHPDPLPGHPDRTCGSEDHFSWGLSDRFSKFAPGGSDCNRAVFFLLRPNDLAFGGAKIENEADIRAAIEEVLEAGG